VRFDNPSLLWKEFKKMSQRISVVIIETSKDSANHITHIIEKIGNGTSIEGVAKDVEEGYQIIHQREPMVVILDVSTEKIDHSLQVINKIVHELPRIFIFVVCDGSSSDIILDFMRAGAHEYFLKPLSENDLSRAFQKLASRGGEKVYLNERECETYSVFSSKNGVGATTIAVNLAVNIFEMTKKPTIIVDLDLIGGDVTTFLSLKPAYTVGDINKNSSRVDEAFLRGVITEHESGISILAAPQDVKGGLSMSGSDVKKMLVLLKRMFKYIVIDTEANFTQSTMAAIEMSDLILMTFILNLPSTINTQRCLSHLEEIGIDGEKIRLVANRYLEKVQISLEDAENILKRSVFYCIPNDFNLAMTCLNKGVTLSAYDPSSTLNSSIRELGMMITGNAAELDMAPAEITTSRIHKLFQTTTQVFRNFMSV
jgi:pilus assembly protein CpaE